MKSHFVCGAKDKQAAVGMGWGWRKTTGTNCVCVSGSSGDAVPTSHLEEGAAGAITLKNCTTLNPFISRTPFIASIQFCILLHHWFSPFTSSLSLSLSRGISPPRPACSFLLSFIPPPSPFLSLSLRLPGSSSAMLLAHSAEGFTGDQLSIELSQLCPL